MSMDRAARPAHFPVLEWVTGAVLVLVLAALAWMIGAAYRPAWFEWASVEVEIIAVLVLLTTSLFLVSVVALLHTRK
jgi:hypothetical protein